MPKDKIYEDTGYLDFKKCRKCGKKFIAAPLHIYRDQAKWYCSWTCFNHRKDKKTDVEVPQ